MDPMWYNQDCWLGPKSGMLRDVRSVDFKTKPTFPPLFNDKSYAYSRYLKSWNAPPGPWMQPWQNQSYIRDPQCHVIPGGDEPTSCILSQIDDLHPSDGSNLLFFWDFFSELSSSAIGFKEPAVYKWHIFVWPVVNFLEFFLFGFGSKVKEVKSKNMFKLSGDKFD